MQNEHTLVLNTLRRVQEFLDDNNQLLKTINQSGSRRILDDIVATLNTHAVTQVASKRISAAEVAKQRVLRNALKLNHMRPIVAVAEAQLRQAPDFVALRMPARNSTSRRLVADAGAMEVAAANYTKTFIDAGLPEDFLAQLRAAAATLEASVTKRGVMANSRSGATAGLNREAARGREIVRVLDALVEPQLAGNDALLVRWKSARTFSGRATGVATTSIEAAAKGTTPTPTPTPTSAPPLVSQPGAPAATTALSPAPASNQPPSPPPAGS